MAARWKPAARLRALTGSLDLEGGQFVMALVGPAWVDTSAITNLSDLTAFTDDGYEFETVTFQAPALDVQGVARALFDDVTFGPFVGSLTIGGWYIADANTTELLFYGTIDDVEVDADSLLVASPLGGTVVLA
jgi:hypothetical protein